ncbi:CDP-glucose 4,6-dehydratase [Selenomonas sp. oral taxon 137 str. F0430]|uniref:CDP-glucose 4,6-dehydratase n=1 Tax=Selenomonas sp. oral taxon 137 TaxID=712531 RepID=UPI0001EB277B|nr:CDP-glucose 4,6-dehydratase [Selenomonas sp. oral taxon 137]EFR41414.1 CDP-glucose 4,6-dehydratase [Selenomonas sp. oral taxon 137 str. F0430]
MNDLVFYRGKHVFLTGHTGFKGMWLTMLLLRAGAEVTGYALDAPTPEGAETLRRLGILDEIRSVHGDVRDLAALRAAFDRASPEVVFHLAAQPIVRTGYAAPVDTFTVNVMGTVNLLECVRTSDTARSVLVVTTDKVYENREWAWGYRECDRLMGRDPYAASKSCAEIAVHSYRESYFADGAVRLSTARAGNVIGGGDFAPDRIVPDCIRAALRGTVIDIRNPASTRPYQHVLEPLAAYLAITARQAEDARFVGAWNVGPDDADCVTTGALADLFCAAWGEGLRWRTAGDGGPHEAHFLKLDASKLRAEMNLYPRWDIRTAVTQTVRWAKAWQADADMRDFSARQIRTFLAQG